MTQYVLLYVISPPSIVSTEAWAWRYETFRGCEIINFVREKKIYRKEGQGWNKTTLFFISKRWKKKHSFTTPVFLHFVLYTMVHVPGVKARWAFFHGKIERLNFRQRVTENRERDDICAGETGTGRQSDKRPGCIDRRKCSWTYYAVISGGSAISIAIFSTRSRNTFAHACSRLSLPPPLSPRIFHREGYCP